jgi:hypothetical protein
LGDTSRFSKRALFHRGGYFCRIADLAVTPTLVGNPAVLWLPAARWKNRPMKHDGTGAKSVRGRKRLLRLFGSNGGCDTSEGLSPHPIRAIQLQRNLSRRSFPISRTQLRVCVTTSSGR